MNIDRYPYAFCASLLSGPARDKFAYVAHGLDHPSPRACYYVAVRKQEAEPAA